MKPATLVAITILVPAFFLFLLAIAVVVLYRSYKPKERIGMNAPITSSKLPDGWRLYELTALKVRVPAKVEPKRHMFSPATVRKLNRISEYGGYEFYGSRYRLLVIAYWVRGRTSTTQALAKRYSAAILNRHPDGVVSSIEAKTVDGRSGSKVGIKYHMGPKLVDMQATIVKVGNIEYYFESAYTAKDEQWGEKTDDYVLSTVDFD